MRAFRFFKKVSTEGTVQLQLNAALVDKEVEIIVLPKEVKKVKSKTADFIKKWAGFLSEKDIKDTKYEYLMEKHK